MKVVNVVGYSYGFTHLGRTIIIPYDSRVYTLPDDVDVTQFGNNLKRIDTPIPTLSVIKETPKTTIIEAPTTTSIVKVEITESPFNTATFIESSNLSTTIVSGSSEVVPVQVSATPKPKTSKPKTVKKTVKTDTKKQSF